MGAPKGLYHGEGLISLGLRSQKRYVATGEYRAPKKDEHYLSGAEVTAYRAPNDYSEHMRYWIARAVEPKFKVQQKVKRNYNGLSSSTVVLAEWNHEQKTFQYVVRALTGELSTAWEGDLEAAEIPEKRCPQHVSCQCL